MPQAPYFSLLLKDSKKRYTRKILEVVPKALLADYLTLASAFAADLEDITDLELVRMDLTITTGEVFAGQAGSNIDVGATFTGTLEDKDGMRASHKVPGIKNSFVRSDGSIGVDLSDAVEDYLAYFVEDTPAELELSDGETIEVWEFGSLDK